MSKKTVFATGCSIFHVSISSVDMSVDYPKSLNVSLHLIIRDFARRRQSLKSKCSL